MSIFKKFGTINYSIDGYSKDAMNILTAAIVKRFNVDKSYVYQRYVVPAGGTPESIAQELYKDPEKYWTILLVNGIVDPFTGWAMDDSVLEDWTRAKYGDVYKVIEFINPTNGWSYDDVDTARFHQMLDNGQTLPFNVHPVTALEYETQLNQKKSEIVVITSRYINQFVDMFNKTIEGKE